DGRRDAARVGDVEVDGAGAATDRRGRFGGGVLVDVGHGHPGPFGGQALRHGPAHAPAGARDEGDASLEAPHAALPSAISVTGMSPAAWRARSSFLSNFPTLVLGISATNDHRSGSHHR